MAHWTTAKQFIDATLGKKYDMDNYPEEQKWQCWDYADFFWLKQTGRSLSTGGTGAARGCWTVAEARKANAGKEFELVTNKWTLKYGDWVIMNDGKYGHVGIVVATNFGKNRITIQSQNHGLIRTKVTKVNFSLDTFLGAFRYKWPKSTPKPATTNAKQGDKVKTSAYYDVYGNKLNRSIINDGKSVWKKTDNHGKHAWLYKGNTLRAIVKVNTLKKTS